MNKKLYKSVVPLKNDATKVYSKGSIRQAVDQNDYFIVGGKAIHKSALNLNQGTLNEIPSDYVEKSNKKDAVLEKIGWQNKAGKPAILQGLARTVGASAAIATGAAYSTAVPTTLAKLGGNVLAGGVATAGYSMLDGRTPTKEEYAYGAAAEMGIPLVIKGAEPIIKPIAKKIDNVVNYLNAPKFNANPEAYYRVIGNEEGLNDAIASNTLRPNQNGIFKGRSAYYTKGAVNDSSNPVVGGGAMKGTTYKGKYIAEVLPGKNYPQVAKELNPEWNFGLTRNGEHIPTSSENVRLYKKDWLKGYREVAKPQIKNNLNEIGNIFKTDKIDADYVKDLFKSYTRPKTSNKDAFNVLGDFRERIATKEGRERMKALGITDDEIFKKLKIVDDNTTFGSYQDQTNTIGLHPEHPLVRKVVRHETEHAVQNAVSLNKLNKYNTDAGNLKYFFRPKYGKQILKDARSGLTDIDKELSSLELRKEPTPNIKFADGKASSKTVDINRYKDLVVNKQQATDYFTYGSGGREKSSFLSEVQQYMMDQNIIPKTSYVKIDENMVKQTFMDAMFDEKNGGKYLRLFNIMKPTDSNYKLVASLLNKMLSTGTVVTVASTTSNKNK